MSLKIDGNGTPIGMVNNSIITIESKLNKNDVEVLEMKFNEKIQIIPDVSKERNIIYVSAPSGSGKSYFTKDYLIIYKKLYPNNPIYLFSSLTEDETIDKVKGIQRIKLNEEFIEEDLKAEDFENSIVIFDDTDCITDKKINIAVVKVLNSILETGRHFKTSLIYTSHVATNGFSTKKILNEAKTIVIFPQNMCVKPIKALCENYFGMDKKNIERIKDSNSRWVAINKTYPQSVITENEVYLPTKLKKVRQIK